MSTTPQDPGDRPAPDASGTGAARDRAAPQTADAGEAAERLRLLAPLYRLLLERHHPHES